MDRQIRFRSDRDANFAERMYVYHYRIYDHYRRPVVSLVVLGDERRDWRPDYSTYSLWSCTTRLDFATVKLLEYGLSPEDVRQFFQLIDWLIALPPELERQFRNEMHQYEEDKKVPYVTSIERLGREEGLAEGFVKGRIEGRVAGIWDGIEGMLDIKSGADGLSLMPAVRAIRDVATLQALYQAVRTRSTLDEVRRLLPQARMGLDNRTLGVAPSALYLIDRVQIFAQQSAPRANGEGEGVKAFAAAAQRIDQGRRLFRAIGNV